MRQARSEQRGEKKEERREQKERKRGEFSYLYAPSIDLSVPQQHVPLSVRNRLRSSLCTTNKQNARHQTQHTVVVSIAAVVVAAVAVAIAVVIIVDRERLKRQVQHRDMIWASWVQERLQGMDVQLNSLRMEKSERK